MPVTTFQESPATILVEGRQLHFACADSRPFLFRRRPSLWIRGTIRGESHGELAFRSNRLLKQGGIPRDAKWSESFEALTAILHAGEGIDFDDWLSGRIWLDAGVVNFWEEPSSPCMVKQILAAFHRSPKDFQVA